MNSSEGKKEFYLKAKEALELMGFEYYDGDRDIRGKGRSHASKPDYIAIKDNVIVIGEIKSPKEGPTSGSWRQVQRSDTEEFKKVRSDVAELEKVGKIPKEVGGHDIIIRGQIPDYVSKLNKTYELPSNALKNGILKGGYTIPTNEMANAEAAFKICMETGYEKIDIGNGSTTYIFSL